MGIMGYYILLYNKKKRNTARKYLRNQKSPTKILQDAP